MSESLNPTTGVKPSTAKKRTGPEILEAPPLSEQLRECRQRNACAHTVVHGATYEAGQSMLRQGWHQCTDVISADEALDEVEYHMGRDDQEIRATRTLTGYIVWVR